MNLITFFKLIFGCMVNIVDAHLEMALVESTLFPIVFIFQYI